MKTKAVRLYGKDDIRLEEFELPEIKDNEILAHVVSDSLCMSSYKAAKQGAAHKRVPDNVAENPIIIGHEFSGTLVKVGAKWSGSFKEGDKFSIQPALNYKGSLDAPGYSYKYIGGDATYIVIPNEVMECGCLLKYEGAGYFPASLSEPLSCIIGAFKANYHTSPGSYEHHMGIKKGGNLALLASAGPMGFGVIDYVIHSDLAPSKMVVTDIDDDRLNRAKELFTVEEAAACGITLEYVNTAKVQDPVQHLMELTDGEGYDDVFVFAPVTALVEQADKIIARDGCVNFFAGPSDTSFSANVNFYKIHYNAAHYVATSGGNNQDMEDAVTLINKGKLNPAVMISHIGGLNAVIETTKNLPAVKGGKKLMYTNLDLELTAIKDFAEKGKTNDLFKKLDELVSKNNNLWSAEAEEYLLANAPKI